MNSHKYINSQKAFTLIELLIVIGIIAILSTVVVLVIKPGQIFDKARDAKRIMEISVLNDAINIYTSGGAAINASTTAVYISIPDTDPYCANAFSELPILPSPWNYQCSSPNNYKNTDGTGWVPINFDSTESGSPLGELPADPVNLAIDGRYYTFVYGSWEITAIMEGDATKLSYGAVIRTGNKKNITPVPILLRNGL